MEARLRRLRFDVGDLDDGVEERRGELMAASPRLAFVVRVLADRSEEDVPGWLRPVMVRGENLANALGRIRREAERRLMEQEAQRHEVVEEHAAAQTEAPRPHGRRTRPRRLKDNHNEYTPRQAG